MRTLLGKSVDMISKLEMRVLSLTDKGGLVDSVKYKTTRGRVLAASL